MKIQRQAVPPIRFFSERKAEMFESTETSNTCQKFKQLVFHTVNYLENILHNSFNNNLL